MSARTALYCWEYGAGLGHVSSLAAIAECLKSHFTNSILLNPDNQQVPKTVGGFDEVVEFPNANTLLGELARSRDKIVSYNATFRSFGYCEPKYLFTRFKLWQEFFSAQKPDLVVGDYAPSAIMVARKMGIPTIATGNGYTLPPTNLASYPRFVDQTDPVSELEILQSVNQVLRLIGLTEIVRVSEIFCADIHACFTDPNLDPFSRVREPHALGPLFKTPPPEYSDERGDRIFVYLTQCRKSVTEQVLAAVSSLKQPVDVYALNVDPAEAGIEAGQQIRFLEAPMSLDEICRNYRLCIHLGSHNFAMELLYAGMPQLSLPIDMEKLLYAQSLENLGYAHQLRLDKSLTVQVLVDKMNEALSDEVMKDVLKRFSKSRPDNSALRTLVKQLRSTGFLQT